MQLVVDNYKAALEVCYGARLWGVVLYGSTARAEAFAPLTGDPR